jgi:hypothetical protein
MIGNPYAYNATVAKITSLFSTLFNEIYVARKNSAGDYVNQKRVPIAYGSPQRYLVRTEQRPELTEEVVAIQLPRMAYMISGAMVYDAEKQKPRESGQRITLANGDTRWLPSPVPYRIPYELSILSKNMDEGLQIIEQIIPYFRPSFGVRFRPFDGESFVDEVNFILNSVNIEDQNEGEFTTQRTLVFTLQFDAVVNIWVGLNSMPRTQIKKVIVNFEEDGTELGVITAEVNPSSAGPEDPHTIDVMSEWYD